MTLMCDSLFLGLNMDKIHFFVVKSVEVTHFFAVKNVKRWYKR